MSTRTFPEQYSYQDQKRCRHECKSHKKCSSGGSNHSSNHNSNHALSKVCSNTIMIIALLLVTLPPAARSLTVGTGIGRSCRATRAASSRNHIPALHLSLKRDPSRSPRYNPNSSSNSNSSGKRSFGIQRRGEITRREQWRKYKVSTTAAAVSTTTNADDYYDNNKGTNDKNTNKVDTKSNIDVSDIAPYSKLLVFISTTIVIWLSEPLLSLVDTTVVGKFASGLATATGSGGVSPETLQLAALGPATMVCDNAFYLVYFLAIAVTNQLASSSGNQDASSVQVKTTSHALGVAGILGGLITISIFCFGGSMLRFIIGEGGAMVNGIDLTSSLVSNSWDYTKIRGFVAPLTVAGMIAQAVCLATLDTTTPALAVLVASVINVVGDIVLVAKCRLGLQGAALATAAAGAASSFILLSKTKKKMNIWRESSSALQKTTLPSFISLPDPKSFVSLVKLAGPIFFVLLGKIICYSSMTLRASDFEMMSLATHNIMLRVFFFFCTFGDAFSMAVQSFLPQVLYGNQGGDTSTADSSSSDTSSDSSSNVNNETNELTTPTRRNKARANQLLKRILLLASGMAISNALLTKTLLQQCGSFFTNDPTILSLLASPSRVFYMMASVFLHPIIMALEGSILATRDLGFLVAAYGGTVTILLSLLQFATSSFTEVWRALFLFQFIRCSTFGWRVFHKTRVQEKA